MKCVCLCGYEQENIFNNLTYDNREIEFNVYAARTITNLYACPKCGSVKTKRGGQS